jgi:ABC-type uncharacterized transport system involved in gliding motility auxiliary subunit
MLKKYSKYAALVGIGCLIAGGVSYSLQDFLSRLSTMLLVIGFLLVLFGMVMNINELITFTQRRDTRYGGNTVVIVVLVTLIVGMLNFIGSRRSIRVDTTESGQFSLSQQTISVLTNLENDVKITAFFKSGTPQRTQISDLLEEYQYHSTKLEVNFVDPDKNPETAKEYNITAYNTTVLECGEMREELTAQDEQTVSNALIRVTRERKKILYFTEGHNERGIDDGAAEGYTLLKESLEAQNYEVRKVLIAREKSVPEDCEVLVIAGAKNELFQAELDTINHWLAAGGKAMVMVDTDPSPGLNEFLAGWDITVGNDMVVDMSGLGQLFGAGPGMPLVSQYGDHDIVKDFGSVATIYPYVRSVRPADTPQGGTTVTSLLETTPQSFGETQMMGNQVRFDEGVDLPGPVSLAVTVERVGDTGTAGASGGKLVVVGDSDFISNRYFAMGGNGDLGLNMLNWLAEESDLISVGPKNREDRRVNLTSTQSDMFFWLSIIGLPGFVVLSGIMVYFRRRSQ